MRFSNVIIFHHCSLFGIFKILPSVRHLVLCRHTLGAVKANGCSQFRVKAVFLYTHLCIHELVHSHTDVQWVDIYEFRKACQENRKKKGLQLMDFAA